MDKAYYTHAVPVVQVLSLCYTDVGFHIGAYEVVT